MSDILQIRKINTELVDLNPYFGLSGEPMLLYGVDVIRGSIRRILSSHLGVKSRISDFRYGCRALEIIQEPLTSMTALRLKVSIIEALSSLEPRILLNSTAIQVEENYDLPGYLVSIPYTIVAYTLTDLYKLSIKVSNG